MKRRVGAFSTTDLEAFLRAQGVDTIVLAGFSTSGVILSTLCWAADRDFRVVVLKDLCADGEPDPESKWCALPLSGCVSEKGKKTPLSVIRAFFSAGDDEIHRVLTEKVFLKQGFVMESAEILAAESE